MSSIPYIPQDTYRIKIQSTRRKKYYPIQSRANIRRPATVGYKERFIKKAYSKNTNETEYEHIEDGEENIKKRLNRILNLSANKMNYENNSMDIVTNSKTKYSSATSYDILSSLDCHRMKEIRQAFIAANNELNVEQFIKVVWPFINLSHFESKYLAVAALITFFEDIDINDDKKMQWNEFTDFLATVQQHSTDEEAVLETVLHLI